MHWAEKEVARLGLSKKLKELGFPQTPDGFYWIQFSGKYHLFFQNELLFDGKDKIKGILTISGLVEPNEVIKAPTSQELSEWLIKKPVIAELGKLYIEYDEAVDKWIICYGKVGKQWVWDDVKVNAYAKMAIWLRKNGHITFNQGGDCSHVLKPVGF